MSKVIDRDLGWKKIKRKSLSNRPYSVNVGIRGHGTGKTNLATIGLYHEKGGKRPGWKKGCPPKRSFIGDTIDKNLSKLMHGLDTIASAISAGKGSKKQGLYAYGKLVENMIKGRIKSGILPRLAASTIKYKSRYTAKVTPLIFHGRLINSITHWLK